MRQIEKTKKTKPHYLPTLKPSYMYCGCDGEVVERFDPPCFQGKYFRSFSTKQERSFGQMHNAEYAREYGLRIRPSRVDGLIDSWDDVPSTAYYVRGCWKHNSKRRKQFYKTKETQ